MKVVTCPENALKRENPGTETMMEANDLREMHLPTLRTVPKKKRRKSQVDGEAAKQRHLHRRQVGVIRFNQVEDGVALMLLLSLLHLQTNLDGVEVVVLGEAHLQPRMTTQQKVHHPEEEEATEAEEEVKVAAEELADQGLVSSVVKRAICQENALTQDQEEEAAVELEDLVHVSNVEKKAICLENVHLKAQTMAEAEVVVVLEHVSSVERKATCQENAPIQQQKDQDQEAVAEEAPEQEDLVSSVARKDTCPENAPMSPMKLVRKPTSAREPMKARAREIPTQKLRMEVLTLDGEQATTVGGETHLASLKRRSQVGDWLGLTRD